LFYFYLFRFALRQSDNASSAKYSKIAILSINLGFQVIAAVISFVVTN